jgi:hypothetical protein
MTTYKGKPFDRPSLESLMRVRDHIILEALQDSY